MSRRLETLTPGTPVYCGEQLIGSVEGVYTEGESRLPEYLAVMWDARGVPVLVATRDVETIDERGVILQSADPTKFDALATFDLRQHPTIKKLA